MIWCGPWPDVAQTTSSGLPAVLLNPDTCSRMCVVRVRPAPSEALRHALNRRESKRDLRRARLQVGANLGDARERRRDARVARRDRSRGRNDVRGVGEDRTSLVGEREARRRLEVEIERPLLIEVHRVRAFDARRVARVEQWCRSMTRSSESIAAA